MKQALICVSFGTTVPAARRDIEAVEAALRAAAPGRQFARAYTSGMIRRTLAARGQAVDSLPEALARLRAGGCRDVIVQPTHFLRGVEYDKLKAEALAAAAGFDRLAVGRPLLDSTADLRALAGILMRLYPARPGQAVVLMGHGSAHFANVVYPALQTAFALAGRPDVRVATVEGWPALDDVRGWLRAQGGVRRVLLAPLMLCAGDHARSDMAGDGPDSWRSLLAGDGCAVECVLRGLGSEEAVQAMYAARLQKLL